MAVACACTNGEMGAQTCRVDGSGYDACECESSTTNATTTDDPSGDPSSGPATSTSASASSDASTGSTSEDPTESSTDSTTTGEPFDLDGWTRRRPITITNDGDSDLDDVQVELRVMGDDDMQADFDDLRFTTDDGLSALPHWLEYRVQPVETNAWIRVPNVPAGGAIQIWMYYGNPGAADGSDGDATMFFVDEFEGVSLDAAKWQATSNDYDVSGGSLTISSGSVYTNDAVVESGRMLQVRARHGCCEQQPGPVLMSAFAQGESMNNDFVALVEINLAVGYRDGDVYGPGSNSLLGYFNQDTWLDVGVARSSGQVHFRRWYGPPMTLSYGADLDGDHYIVLGHQNGATAGETAVHDVEYDAAFVRRFAVLEPIAVAGDEEVWP